MRVVDHLQVGQDVADFLAVEERHAADQHVRQLGPPQLGFERPRLLVGAAQDRDVARLRRLAAASCGAMSATTRSASCVSSWQLQDPRPLAAAARRAQHLVVPLAVEGDQRVGELEDRAGRAVVVFQPHDLGLGPVVLEPQDVRHLGAAPAVDRLVVVAHDAQVAVAAWPAL